MSEYYNNPGTLAEPWRTIQYAASSSELGDTVNVRGGVYTETVFINVSGSEDGGGRIHNLGGLRANANQTCSFQLH